jgi:hypothetical protein
MKSVNMLRLMAILLMAITFFSCKKYLNEKSDKSLVVPTTLTDLQGMLDDNFYMNSRTPGFGETSADDYFVKLSDYNSFGNFNQLAYTWRLETYTFGNDWNFAYTAVYNVNYCLEKIDKIQKTVQNEYAWNNIKGSALFFRAYYFLLLSWEYSKAYDENTSQKDLGIVLRLGSDFNVPSVRASTEDSYAQTINDLKQAIVYLPENAQTPMRPSKAACYGALARAYLSMRKYDSAFKYADACLKIKSDLLDYNSADVNPGAGVPFQPFNKEIIFYTTQSGNYPAKSRNFALIDSLLYSSYEDNDLRKTAFFFPNKGYHGFKGNYSSSRNSLFNGIATDELFLVRAECNARAGRVGQAMEDLNTLLLNRWRAGTFIPVSPPDAATALNKILLERRKELLMRGLRWIDVKRLNKEGLNIIPKRILGSDTYTLMPNDGKYALPLPTDIINITGMPQN